MPAKQRVRSHDGRDLPQPSTAQRIRSHGESAPIVIRQLQASTPQLAAKNTILFEQITKDFSLLAVQPPGEEREQQLESGGVDHGRSLYHGTQIVGSSSVDPVMRHYGLAGGCVWVASRYNDPQPSATTACLDGGAAISFEPEHQLGPAPHGSFQGFCDGAGRSVRICLRRLPTRLL
jgi:hypothetical protein